MDVFKVLSDNIESYRQKSNISQDELAEKLGVSRQSVSLRENGQTQLKATRVAALAAAVDLAAVIAQLIFASAVLEELFDALNCRLGDI